MCKGVNKIRLLLLILILGISQIAVSKDSNPMSLEEASDHIRETTNGKVLSARTVRSKNSKSHRIQVLTPTGRVKVYMVPAQERNNKQNFFQRSENNFDKNRRYTNDKNNTEDSNKSERYQRNNENYRTPNNTNNQPNYRSRNQSRNQSKNQPRKQPTNQNRNSSRKNTKRESKQK